MKGLAAVTGVKKFGCGDGDARGVVEEDEDDAMKVGTPPAFLI